MFIPYICVGPYFQTDTYKNQTSDQFGIQFEASAEDRTDRATQKGEQEAHESNQRNA